MATSRNNHGKFDDCKGPLRHAWFAIDVERKSSFGTPIHFKCERCGTLKKEIYDVHGDLAARYYEYPVGYREEGRVPYGTYRLRLLNKTNVTSLKKRRAS